MKSDLIEWGIAERPYPGETESGDRYVVKTSGDCAMIAVIDGIGHGGGAATAAKAAVDVLETFFPEPVSSLLQRCHERLRPTRGATMTLVAFETATNTLSWVGAGNVAAALVRADPCASPRCRELLIRSGVVGSQLPMPGTSRVRVEKDDLLILATDGIDANFINSVRSGENPQRIADRLLSDFQLAQDDALVVVVRIVGAELE